jgi:hypothetical protein
MNKLLNKSFPMSMKKQDSFKKKKKHKKVCKLKELSKNGKKNNN